MKKAVSNESSNECNRFAEIGICIDGITFLSPAEANSFLSEDAVLVDLRSGDFENNGREFDVNSIVFLPHDELKDGYSVLSKDSPLILADCVGLHAREAARFLVAKGYSAVAALIGGMVDWSRAGMPTIVDPDGKLTGSCACRLRPTRAFRSRSGC